jgi:hypothetical protein
LLGSSLSGWFPLFASEAAANPQRKRHCILLWMTGGPTQTDTFDMKPGHANGGEFKETTTNTPGVRFSEHLPKLAQHADKMAIIRSLSTKEGDHGRGTFLIRTGQQPGGPLRYPTMGSVLSKELGDPAASLPNYVSISPYTAFNPRAFSPGFLGPHYAAATVGERAAFTDQPPSHSSDASYAELGVDHLMLPKEVTQSQAKNRLELWDKLQKSFLSTRDSATALAQDTVYRRAVNMMQSTAANAFDLTQEPDKVRRAYGRTRFGQGCLMARRLIERGVPFVEVSLGFDASNNLGWDTHAGNFPAVRSLSAQLDAGWGTLMTELKERGLLESTTILWIGEFGRTPVINSNAGRDHFPNAWTCVLAGGGIKGGQCFGKTSDDGQQVVDGKVDVSDVLATLCQAVGVNPSKENISDLGRPIRIVEGNPIAAIVS